MVLLHRVWKKNPVSVDFLGIYIANDNNYSPLVHGLIGMSLYFQLEDLTGCILSQFMDLKSLNLEKHNICTVQLESLLARAHQFC